MKQHDEKLKEKNWEDVLEYRRQLLEQIVIAKNIIDESFSLLIFEFYRKKSRRRITSQRTNCYYFLSTFKQRKMKKTKSFLHMRKKLWSWLRVKAGQRIL